VAVPPAAEPAGGPGRRYMERRRAEYGAREARRARAEALVERVVAELAIERPLVWHETCTSEGVAASLAVLVPTERALEGRADLERIAARLADVVPVVNGPWPPYTFARTE
jgi:gas vesicle protein GvpL/GvpF